MPVSWHALGARDTLHNDVSQQFHTGYKTGWDWSTRWLCQSPLSAAWAGFSHWQTGSEVFPTNQQRELEGIFVIDPQVVGFRGKSFLPDSNDFHFADK